MLNLLLIVLFIFPSYQFRTITGKYPLKGVTGSYSPEIKIIIHDDCIYSQALKTLLDWSKTPYKALNASKDMDLVKTDKRVPRVYLNGKHIGGYKDSLLKWIYIYKKLPLEPDFNKLMDPEYVVSKYKQR